MNTIIIKLSIILISFYSFNSFSSNKQIEPKFILNESIKNCSDYYLLSNDGKLKKITKEEYNKLKDSEKTTGKVFKTNCSFDSEQN